jgi:hypothetical protein
LNIFIYNWPNTTGNGSEKGDGLDFDRHV